MCIIQAICVAYLWHSQAPAQHITVGIGPGTVVGKVTVGYGQEKVGKNQVGKVISSPDIRSGKEVGKKGGKGSGKHPAGRGQERSGKGLERGFLRVLPWGVKHCSGDLGTASHNQQCMQCATVKRLLEICNACNAHLLKDSQAGTILMPSLRECNAGLPKATHQLENQSFN